MGKVVRCHEVIGNEETLTEGKVYKYKQKDDEMIELLDDTGKYNWYCVGAFESLSYKDILKLILKPKRYERKN